MPLILASAFVYSGSIANLCCISISSCARSVNPSATALPAKPAAPAFPKSNKNSPALDLPAAFFNTRTSPLERVPGLSNICLIVLFLTKSPVAFLYKGAKKAASPTTSKTACGKPKATAILASRAVNSYPASSYSLNDWEAPTISPCVSAPTTAPLVGSRKLSALAKAYLLPAIANCPPFPTGADLAYFNPSNVVSRISCSALVKPGPLPKLDITFFLWISKSICLAYVLPPWLIICLPKKPAKRPAPAEAKENSACGVVIDTAFVVWSANPSQVGSSKKSSNLPKGSKIAEKLCSSSLERCILASAASSLPLK